ncbi:type II toxin-antitoxin system HicB family antitoxin [Thiobaca trueperi]|uniref:Putative HicB family RNase H-like nuclease n=1 Tax=Thiobaca trueperi TaxID=127458 RepID=A0A4R3MTF4_9GAMM|nr:type II toxin-antitoxin system HicB family antitoxin [Thiobaca trueperi]TCT19720.1 putative HicB family RNase H-like nuclease [Thiobaca trueperi]
MSAINVMSYRGYQASMTFDPDDKIIVGRVIDIDDIIGFHGESISEFENAFHEAIDDYLDACAKLDQEPDKPASGRLMLRVDPAIHAAAIKAAKRERTSLNQWAAKVLAQAAHAQRSGVEAG